MDAARLTAALAALAVLISLALLTWIAVRVEQAARRPLPKPPAPEPCRRLHVADLPKEWLRPRSAPPYRSSFPAEDDAPFPTDRR